MSACALAERATGLAMLPPHDEERIAALQHASGCPECTRRFREAAMLGDLLARVPAPAPPSQATCARIAAAVLAELAAEKRSPASRARARRWRPSLIVSAAVGLVGATLLVLKHQRPGRGWMAPALLALVASLLTMGAVALGTLVTAAVVAVSTVASFFFGGPGGGVDVALGTHCAALEVVTSLVPLGAAAYLALRRAPSEGLKTTFFAAVAAGGALAGQAALHPRCPSTALSHLLVFHTGGVVLAAALGLLIARLPQLRAAKSG